MRVSKLRNLIAAALICLSLLVFGGSANAAPLPTCSVTATVSSQLTGFILFEGYRGIGRGILNCDQTVSASTVSVTVEVSPGGADSNAKPCTNSSSCETDADAATARAPVNCTFVEAAGQAVGALGFPGGTATDCNTTDKP